jgi:hypothetical protein
MSALSNYGGWSDEDAANEEKEQESKASGASAFLIIKPDTTVVARVIPALSGSPFKTFFKHFYKDPTTGKMVSYPCPAKEAGRPCPDCIRAANLMSASIQVDKDLGYKIRAKPRALVNLWIRPTDEELKHAEDEGLDTPLGVNKVWEVSSWVGKKKGKSMHEKLLALKQNARVGGNYTDPSSTGFDLLIERHGAELNTRYEVYALKTEPCPLLADEQAAIELIESGQYDLAKFTVPPTDEQVQQILQGNSGPPSGGPRVGGGTQRRSLPPRSTRTAGDMAEEGYGEGGAGEPSF